MANMGKYLYCFIKENQAIKFGVSELMGLKAPVQLLTIDDISAVVSIAPILEYDPTRKNMMAHQRVLKTVMESYSVLPVAFGTVFNHSKEIYDIIQNHYSEIVSELEILQDKVELGLRIMWEEEFFQSEITSPEIEKLKAITVGRPEEKVITEKIELGKLVEKMISQKREEYSEKMNQILLPLTVNTKSKENLPVKGLLNSYFLIDKAKEKEFDELVLQLENQYKGQFKFTYTGPWPAYNFVKLRF